MKIINNTQSNIIVSVNKWGDDGQTGRFTVSPGRSGSWNRTDERGFVMAILKKGVQDSFYIFSDSDIKVFDSYVTDNGRRIKPATDRYY
ncbi:Unnamed protein product [Xenorhabdus bovienii str. Jollieti]|uniref:Unnamed protein product n=1 Tax=Xenorhabdus bovienii (strain SS-2004) TaxID=406818 RepID=D3UXA7_XENBS|nr:hypothetical protein [Xenorhabdus bovienii]CBJ80219.1 Unnamed protein product [Xenorhabdus bovienii SS-2004]CDH29928.1 Unnamed protein product [Xenorhabdus bovienii str. Jollieti]